MVVSLYKVCINFSFVESYSGNISALTSKI